MVERRSDDPFRVSTLRMASSEERSAAWRAMSERGEVFELGDGHWVLTSADAVQYAHRNPMLFSSSPMSSVHGELPVRTVPSAVDPPEHIRFRRVLDPLFAPRVVDAMSEELRAQVRALVSAFAPNGTCDAVAELAVPYPTSVFLSVFGLPLADRDQLVEWVRTMVDKTHRKDPGARDESDEASWRIYEYMRRYVEQKREQPGDDVLSRVLALEGGDAWPLDEIVGLCILVSMAGLDTVTAAIGFMLLHLARDPALRRRVVDDSGAASAFIEEVLRLEPPAPMFPRLTTKDVEIRGIDVPAGSLVTLCLATANRDPDRYTNPDAIDIDRVDRGHLTFGGGVHRCLGSHLARRELRLVLEEFHAQIPDYDLAPGFEPAVEWPSGTLRLEALPLVFPPRTR